MYLVISMAWKGFLQNGHSQFTLHHYGPTNTIREQRVIPFHIWAVKLSWVSLNVLHILVFGSICLTLMCFIECNGPIWFLCLRILLQILRLQFCQILFIILWTKLILIPSLIFSIFFYIIHPLRKIILPIWKYYMD